MPKDSALSALTGENWLQPIYSRCLFRGREEKPNIAHSGTGSTASHAIGGSIFGEMREWVVCGGGNPKTEGEWPSGGACCKGGERTGGVRSKRKTHTSGNGHVIGKRRNETAEAQRKIKGLGTSYGTVFAARGKKIAQRKKIHGQTKKPKRNKGIKKRGRRRSHDRARYNGKVIKSREGEGSEVLKKKDRRERGDEGLASTISCQPRNH